MSGNVGSVIFWSGMVENVGVAIGIALPSIFVQKLFPLPVSTSGFVVDISVSDVARCWTMLAVSYAGRAWSKMQVSRWDRFAIYFRSRDISTSGLLSGCRSMSGNVDSVIFKSGMVENVGLAIEVSFVVAIHAQVSCIYTNFKVFPVFQPPYRISGMCQIWSECTI